MIELNLLPEELRKKKRKKIELPELPLIPIAIVFVGVLILVQLLLSGLIFLSQKQLGELKTRWQELAPKKEGLTKLKNSISDTTEKTKAIEGLIEKRLNWSLLLNELSNSLTANIWLTDLSYDEKKERHAALFSQDQTISGRAAGKTLKPEYYRLGTLTVSGCASGVGEEATAYIARFIKNLKENEAFFGQFEDIELVSITKVSLGERDVMKFTLLCRFKPKVAEG